MKNSTANVSVPTNGDSIDDFSPEAYVSVSRLGSLVISLVGADAREGLESFIMPEIQRPSHSSFCI